MFVYLGAAKDKAGWNNPAVVQRCRQEQDPLLILEVKTY